MFRWYEHAEICFVHLADVSADEDFQKKGSSFRKCRWFKRGWTLQEMLAPATLVFYDKAWSVISDKDDVNLRTVITEVTGIDDYFLSPGIRSLFGNAQQWLSRASVAERMSWAAGRETTRKEDLAYCLLGIFDISMPMLYGEGMKAFQRLQEEIMKVDDDCSLLCWGFEKGQLIESEFDDGSSILAPHPNYFRNCRGIKPCALPGFILPSFSLNQRGLCIRAPIRDDVTHEHLSYVVLGCSSDAGPSKGRGDSDNKELFLALPLVSKGACKSRSVENETQTGEYHRPSWCRPTLVSKEFLKKAESKELLVRRTPKEPVTFLRCPFRILFQDSKLFRSATVLAVYPPQPIPGALASLGRRNSDLTSIEEWPSKDTPRSNVYLRRKGRGLHGLQDGAMEAGDIQVMIHMRFPSKEFFLVMIELSENKEHRAFRCRMYQCSKQLSFEDLHALSVSQDYKQLNVLGCERTGGYFSFKMNDASGITLEAMYTSMSDVDRVIIGVQDEV
jgi:hypothetical protein